MVTNHLRILWEGHQLHYYWGINSGGFPCSKNHKVTWTLNKLTSSLTKSTQCKRLTRQEASPRLASHLMFPSSSAVKAQTCRGTCTTRKLEPNIALQGIGMIEDKKHGKEILVHFL